MNLEVCDELILIDLKCTRMGWSRTLGARLLSLDGHNPFTMVSQEHCRANLHVMLYRTHIASIIHTVVMHKFGPVILHCIILL